LSADDLNSLIKHHQPQIQDALSECPRISYFEVFTALAVSHFAEARAEWVVMEAGLGGVRDATNIFEAHQVRVRNRARYRRMRPVLARKWSQILLLLHCS
jgi:folylpolyglutamate synthase/dihydropteroate synthase